MKQLAPADLDAIATRLEEIEHEEDQLRAKLVEQVQEFGFAPPRTEKSKRLLGDRFQFTVSVFQVVELRDVEVERIRNCKPGNLFEKLFTEVTRFKLRSNATAVLANKLPPDAPKNLRAMFARAVITKESGPRLKVEALECPIPTT